MGSHRGGLVSLGGKSARSLLSVLGGASFYQFLAAVLVTILAMLCLAITVAIFTDVQGWAKWGLGVMWALNTFIALQLVLVYAASKSPHPGADRLR